jgi:hypothetical protein
MSVTRLGLSHPRVRVPMCADVARVPTRRVLQGLFVFEDRVDVGTSSHAEVVRGACLSRREKCLVLAPVTRVVTAGSVYGARKLEGVVVGERRAAFSFLLSRRRTSRSNESHAGRAMSRASPCARSSRRACARRRGPIGERSGPNSVLGGCDDSRQVTRANDRRTRERHSFQHDRQHRAPRAAARVGFGILLFIVTFGLYGLYWAFKTQEEMKRRTGEGLGGVLGLVIWILIGAVSAFVIPSEVGKMYAKDGLARRSPGGRGSGCFPAASSSSRRSSGS